MKLNQQAIDSLAAEYALGTLRGAARRRFETLLQTNVELKRAVASWQDKLHPLGLMGAPVAPPAQLWDAIAARTLNAPLSGRSPLDSLREALDRKLRFWRRIGLSSAAVATLLLAVLVAGRFAPSLQEPGAPEYVAVFSDKQAAAFLVASASADGRVRLRLLQKPDIPADRSLELWALAPNGKPTSLGLLAEGQRELKLEPGKYPADAPGLAISLEPAGGSSKSDGPSGPILYTGKWLPV